MPEISRFFGIVIKMYFDDHQPPHFHAEYGEYKGIFNILTLGMIAGELPPRAKGLIIEWATLHQKELIDNWNRATNFESLNSIEPLK